MGYKRIEIDGNDGTGKTTRVKFLKKMYPGYEILDRGLLSQWVMEDFRFNSWYQIDQLVGFREDTLYITLYTTVEKSQERIVKRGDSLDEEYHNKEDLCKYNARFAFLAQHERVNFIKSDDFVESMEQICSLIDSD